MTRLKALILTTTLLLLSITLLAGLEIESNRLNTENTFNAITASILDTSLGYDYNHTVRLILNTTITNKGPLDVSFTGLSSTIRVGGKPVSVTSLSNLTLMAGGSLSLGNSESVLNIPDQDESLYRALKARSLLIVVDFSGFAEVNGVTRSVTFSRNTTTGFLHGPGEGPPNWSTVEGLLNSYNIPRASQEYASIVGTLTSIRFSASLIYAGSVYNNTFDALALVTKDRYPLTYIILIQDSHIPVAYDSSDYLNLRFLDTVYASGMAFRYKGWDGKEYLVLIPVDISATKTVDIVEEARNYLISRVGEVNFDRCFFNPLVLKYMDNDQGAVTSYTVEFSYPVWGGDVTREFTVSVFFSSNRTITGSYGVPPVENLAPYRVDSPEAKRLALEAGLPRGSYPLEWDMYYWHTDTGPVPVWADRYLWEVRSWIDPPESNPRMLNFALVDPSTGEVYEIGKFGIVSITLNP